MLQWMIILTLYAVAQVIVNQILLNWKRAIHTERAIW